MSVPPVDGAHRGRDRGRDDRSAVNDEQAAQFHAAMRRRQRPRGRQGDDETTSAASPVPPPLPLWQMAIGGAARIASPDGNGGGLATTTIAAAAEPSDQTLFPAGAEVHTGAGGQGLHLRFTQGAWAGMELQAALHAGQIVVTLRPVNKQQHKRLMEAKNSLCDQVVSETGENIKLEIVDAAR